MKKGKLIVVEGACDGIGKTTQYDLLFKKLEKDNYKLVRHHFPSYNTIQGALVEKYLKGDYGEPQDLSPYFINSLYAIDRAATWNESLKFAYEQGKIILLDRYTTSSMIYQSSTIEDLEKRKQFIDDVEDFEYNKLQIPKPDEVLFLHAPFELVTKIRNARKQNDGIANDIHERNIDFMKKVYDNAMFLADYLSWDKVKCDENGSLRKIEDIHEENYQKVKKIINQ